MTRIVTHEFATLAEAEAFDEGVKWVNDGATTTISPPFITIDDRGAVIYEDEDGDEDATWDHTNDLWTMPNRLPQDPQHNETVHAGKLCPDDFIPACDYVFLETDLNHVKLLCQLEAGHGGGHFYDYTKGSNP